MKLKCLILEILILWGLSVHISPSTQISCNSKHKSHSLEEKITENGLGHHISLDFNFILTVLPLLQEELLFLLLKDFGQLSCP